MSEEKRKFSAPQVVAIILFVLGIALIGYVAAFDGPIVLLAAGASDFIMAAFFWRMQPKSKN